MDDLASVFIKKGGARSLKAGGLWIYDNEIERFEEPSSGKPFENGDLVNVFDFDGYPLGVGYYNPASTISVRMLSRKKGAVIDDVFLERRVRDAWEYRKTVTDTSCCRVIYGEADFLPGIVVDKFSDVLVVESMTLGMDRLKDLIIEKLKEILTEDGITVRGVYERSAAKERRKEGLQPVNGFIGEPFDTNVLITENGIRYFVDVAEGQKTGYFLDQKYNRLAVRKLCSGKRVLDCFTHTGSFALNAAYGGACEVLGVDSSSPAIGQAKKNAELNNFEDRVSFEVCDIFDLLPELDRKGERYDVVILDPPAFAKSRNSVRAAVKGYREINLRAMKLINDGGYLATCSCSHFMTDELFAKTVREAASGAHRRLRQVEYRTQAPDHPILWGDDESAYLKFLILQVCDEK